MTGRTDQQGSEKNIQAFQATRDATNRLASKYAENNKLFKVKSFLSGLKFFLCTCRSLPVCRQMGSWKFSRFMERVLFLRLEFGLALDERREVAPPPPSNSGETLPLSPPLEVGESRGLSKRIPNLLQSNNSNLVKKVVPVGVEVCVPVVKGFQFGFCLVDVIPEPFVSEPLVEEVEVELLSLDHSVPPITTLLIHAPPTKVRKTYKNLCNMRSKWSCHENYI